ncbi:hypothetical protein CDG77_27575 [Nostoc sp. 'Peltigera membranacea cyanobiont' 213]|uniref:hypothetical protein n=1 Tax=Nostoc sp. 'Peltigera membranacea cyanobiont' 213 TaxID=2014530 RepID=UPI000B953327|nr:hypothetical protein [Nostoc sp. 'Peltigera membranacea cyanobiont' 213]OYD87764.1 hypothetical protein CDG77_27575 [Nostoc sp. 'Peltigera membranacea cyanobiont' 213]
MNSQLLFSDYFEIDESILDEYGALNICIESDLPLFIDPFLLFASDRAEYQALHDKIVGHLINLKQIAIGNPQSGLNLFQFPEVKQNWLGLCKWGNNGKGLGPKFARNLITAFNGFYANFGNEDITTSSHIEKLTLVGTGIGRDFISDFTTNLMLEHLLEYTQEFARLHLQNGKRKIFSVRCSFDSNLMIWKPKTFELPYFFKGDNDGDFLILTPMDILTKDDAFICHGDFTSKFRQITNALDNSALRDAINRYFQERLPKNPKKDEIKLAIDATVKRYPEILDYYIQYQEENRDKAAALSSEKVTKLRTDLISTLNVLCKHIVEHSTFYQILPNSYQSALQRAQFLKQVIEDNDGYRIFYKNGKPIASEDTIQRIFRLTWFASPMDVNSEVNNGRGPADYKISRGDRDSTIIEFKLGSSSSLQKNLLNQTEIYKKASRSISDIKVILCYTQQEITKVARILKKINQENAENIIVIDATKKESASKV